MAFDVTTARHRAASTWSGFTSGQKTMLALAGAALLAGGWLFTRWAAEPSWAALYGNLSATDAAAITQELGSQGVRYKLAEGGATVMVPQAAVYQLRLDMSGKGLPTQGSPGYALLDKQGITTSEFRQRVDYQRALEGELARTVGAIEGVRGADVHLVIPADDLFTEDASKPSASVLLRGAPGTKFAPGQVRAIVHLVASSVEGLAPDAVTVADAEGRVLSAPGEDGNAAAGDVQAGQAKEFEDHLASSIEEMLAPVTGSGGAVVRVNATLDFDERSVTTERFDRPDAPPLLSESTVKETFTGPGASTGGGVPPGGGGGPSDYQKEQADRSFAVGKVTEQVKSAPGRVSRLSVAVMLDRANKAKTDEVQALVTAAAGLDPKRGDVVEVRQMTFDRTTAKEAAKELQTAEKAKSRSELLSLVQTVGALLIVLVVLLLAWRSARKASVIRYPVGVPGMLPAADVETLAALVAARGASPAGPPEQLEMAAAAARAVVAGAVPAANPPLVPAPVTDEISVLIDRQPEEVAQILRSWLADRRR